MRWKELDPKKFKGSKQELHLWKIRSTLIRVKRPQRVCDIRGDCPPALQGKQLDKDNPPHVPFDCPDKECEVCFQQFFPAAVQMSDEEARESITQLTRSMFEDLEYLRHLASTQARTLASRWRNKSKAKRRELLKEHTTLHPEKWAAVHLLNLHSEDSPDREYLAGIVSKTFTGKEKLIAQLLVDPLHDLIVQNATTKKYRDTWLLPYLDIETLAEDPSRFLNLLCFRLMCAPSEWAGFDDTQLVLSEHLAVVVPAFNKHCVVLKGPDFGTLVPWDAERAHRWEIVGFNKARQLLTAQAAMARLLRSIASAVLPGNGITASVQQSLVQVDWQAQLQVTCHATMIARSQYINQPFSAPPACNPSDILDLVTNRWKSAADDLWLLQTDPAYVQFRFREISSAAYFEHVDAEERWHWYTDELMLNALRRETWWRQLKYECEELMSAYTGLSAPDAIKSGRHNYDLMLYVVQDCCIELLALQIEMLNFGLPFQRGFERNYVLKSDSGPRSKRTQPTVDSRDFFIEDRLFWSLSCIGFDDYRPFTLDPVVNMRVLDDYITKAPRKDVTRLSQQTYDHVSDIAAVDEVRFAIRCERSRCQTFSKEAIKKVMQVPPRTDYMKKIQKVSFSQINMQVSSSLKEVCTSHAWPTGPKNEAWLQGATRSRESLSRFWSKIRAEYASRLTRAGVLDASLSKELEALSADQEENHLVDVEAERQAVLRASVKTRNVSNIAAASDSLWQQDLVFAARGKENEVGAGATPTRKKFRKTTTAEQANQVEDQKLLKTADQISLTKPHSKIPVKKENLRIFTQMFSAGEQSPGRKVAWQHFCNAMADAGFSIQQGSGSSVCFQQGVHGNGAGSIVFHRPHPDPTIDPIMLRVMGKRLRKWFHWDKGSFVERTN
ncbi:putative mRNA binding protein [Elsinoe australis]|uniref:Putative mRNA binding protein n=1 Tax=Elsinoe australis TaxID=40998 RepID=A0A4U7AX34_9PEZI|nr:putative mRNA binding protein [Elsinoe australis]